MIQYFGRDAYKQFWHFSKEEQQKLENRLASELSALRGKIVESQEEIASAVGVSRQTYSAFENRTRPIPWSMFLALLADEYANRIGFGLELAQVIDQHLCDVPRKGFFNALYNTHPYNDDRVAALQNLGVPYSRY